MLEWIAGTRADVAFACGVAMRQPLFALWPGYACILHRTKELVLKGCPDLMYISIHKVCFVAGALAR